MRKDGGSYWTASLLLGVLGIALVSLSLLNGMGVTDQRMWLVVLVCSAVSSIAGFAFSALAGSLLLQLSDDALYIVQVMLVASITMQTYSVWRLRADIHLKPLMPFFAGGAATVVPGVLLLLKVKSGFYMGVLGVFLMAYAAFMLARPTFRWSSDGLLPRLIVGALGGLSGALAAFPGAFITIWCGFQSWEKRQQRAIYQPFILGMQILTLSVLFLLQPHQALSTGTTKFALAAGIGAVIGMRVFDRLSLAQFQKVVAAFLLISGFALVARAW